MECVRNPTDGALSQLLGSTDYQFFVLRLSNNIGYHVTIPMSVLSMMLMMRRRRQGFVLKERCLR